MTARGAVAKADRAASIAEGRAALKGAGAAEIGSSEKTVKTASTKAKKAGRTSVSIRRSRVRKLRIRI